MNHEDRVTLYRDRDGAYRERASGQLVTPTEKQLAAIAALDAGGAGALCHSETPAFHIEGVGTRSVGWVGWYSKDDSVWCYNIPDLFFQQRYNHD